MPLTRRPMTLAAALAVTLGASALSLPALAADRPDAARPRTELTKGTLDWGLKESFRRYVTGMAAGSITAADGAQQAAGNGPFTFTGGTGTYDTATHGTDVAFRGAVRFRSTLHSFDIAVSDVKVVTAGTKGRIEADVTLNGATQQDIAFADLDLSGVTPGHGANGAMTFKGVPATLTADGAKAFNGMYQAGAALDPATLTVTAAPASPAPPRPTPSTTGTTPPPARPTTAPTDRPSPSTSTPPHTGTSPRTPDRSGARSVDGRIVKGTLDWGVKESFRSYLTGPLARGKVELSGGAAAHGTTYRFGAARGSYRADGHALDAAFHGAVRFLGHRTNGVYALDLRFSALHVRVEGGSGSLIADVATKDRESGEVSTYRQLTVATLALRSGVPSAQRDVVALDRVPATLTEGGAKAFGGSYRAGDALDPVSVAVALTDDARLPSSGASSDGASTAPGATGPAGSTGPSGSTGTLAATGSDVPAGPLATAAALTVAAGASAVAATRRSRRRPANRAS
ncbi:HtaA domain-containing protein [Streptomyces noursei]|uniref:HtaA domain-containing protein n=1 Tax=Streptomyces noursei TaxID=1971 RepID=UPI00380E6E15